MTTNGCGAPYDDDGETWARHLTLPVEELRRFTTMSTIASMPNRWFRSPNVLDLVEVRRRRAAEREGK